MTTYVRIFSEKHLHKQRELIYGFSLSRVGVPSTRKLKFSLSRSYNDVWGGERWSRYKRRGFPDPRNSTPKPSSLLRCSTPRDDGLVSPDLACEFFDFVHKLWDEVGGTNHGRGTLRFRTGPLKPSRLPTANL